jgi:hypothetical protein
MCMWAELLIAYQNEDMTCVFYPGDCLCFWDQFLHSHSHRVLNSLTISKICFRKKPYNHLAAELSFGISSGYCHPREKDCSLCFVKCCGYFPSIPLPLSPLPSLCADWMQAAKVAHAPGAVSYQLQGSCKVWGLWLHSWSLCPSGLHICSEASEISFLFSIYRSLKVSFLSSGSVTLRQVDVMEKSTALT